MLCHPSFLRASTPLAFAQNFNEPLLSSPLVSAQTLHDAKQASAPVPNIRCTEFAVVNERGRFTNKARGPQPQIRAFCICRRGPRAKRRPPRPLMSPRVPTLGLELKRRRRRINLLAGKNKGHMSVHGAGGRGREESG